MWSCPPRKGTEAARYNQGDKDTRLQRLTKHPPRPGEFGTIQGYIRAFGRGSEKVAPEVTGTGEGHCLVSKGTGQSSRWRPWLV